MRTKRSLIERLIHIARKDEPDAPDAPLLAAAMRVLALIVVCAQPRPTENATEAYMDRVCQRARLTLEFEIALARGDKAEIEMALARMQGALARMRGAVSVADDMGELRKDT